jgi:spermidine synthase
LSVQIKPAKVGLDRGAHLLVVVFGFIFFFSGLSSLVYQVVWVRMLSLFFGSDIYSATITLSVFMGGLALGAWLASLFGDRSRRPLVVYGVVEVAIGMCALAVPIILDVFQPEYRSIYRSYIDTAPLIYHAFRTIVAISALLMPTVLMGATLPLLVRYFAQREAELGRRAGLLYAVNTFGALSGTLLAGFLLLPNLGVRLTVNIVVGLNLLLGMVAVGVGVNCDRLDVVTSVVSETTRHSRRLQGAVLVAIGLSGLAALALEVVWIRILVQSFSATVYAFAIMLASFLFGIQYGSLKASWQVDRSPRPAHALAELMFGLAVAVTAVAVLSDFAPQIFGALVWRLSDVLQGAFGAASVVAQFVVASILIGVPALMLGATFPFSVKAYNEDLERRASSTGKVYAANTTGAIAGSLLGGLVLLPMVGSRNSMLVIACIFAGAGFVLLFCTDRVSEFLRRRIILLEVAVGVCCAFGLLTVPSKIIANYGIQRSTHPAVIYQVEGIAHTVDIVRNKAGIVIMMIDGNVEADTSLIQRRHFVLKAYLPLLLHPNPEVVNVIGLGLGITLRSIVRYPTVKSVRLIELAPDLIKAQKYLTKITDSVLGSPKVRLRIDDGRNFLSMTDESFDVITADPIHPRITGVGYLYTREYYEAIKSRLRPGGIVTQWMPMYSISRQSFDIAFRTFAQVFPNATFWYVRGHGLFIASVESLAIDCRNVIRMFNNSAVKADMASIEINSPFQLLGHLLMDRHHIAKYLARSRDDRINTDDNAFLEYHTPFEFPDRTDAIMPDLVRYAGWNPDEILKNCSVDQANAILDHFRGRLTRIQPELAEPLR